MAALGSQSIAASYEQLLHVDRDQGGDTTTHVSVKDGDNGTTFGFTIATDALMMSSTNRLEFGDTGTYIHQSADGVLDLVSDTEIEINATTIDINGAVDISGDTTTAGNLIIDADDKGLTLGADQDATIFADGVGSIRFVSGTDFSYAAADTEGWIEFDMGTSAGSSMKLVGGEGGSAGVYLYADTGDDNDDLYKIEAETDGDLAISSYSSGSWVTNIQIDGSKGATNMATQPAFLVRPATGQDDIATDSNVTIIFGTEVFDQGGDFASNTFTAPTAGRYQLSVSIYLSNIDSAAGYYQLSLVTSNRTYNDIIDPDFGQDAAYWTLELSVLADMDGSDTASIGLFQSGGTAQTDTGANSFFSGHLAC